MVPPIGELVSQCFYSGEITSEPREIDNNLSLALGKPVVWFSTSNMLKRNEARRGTSFSNDCEASIVTRLLKNIAGIFKWTGKSYKVAVLTGYSAQKTAIERKVAASSSELDGITVMINTVDAFQGQEADVCIFSMTRSNHSGSLGFLKSDKRINVALSRGREALVVVGDADFCRASHEAPNPMADVLEYMEQNSDCLISDGSYLK